MVKIKLHDTTAILSVLDKLATKRFNIKKVITLAKVKKEVSELRGTLITQETAIFEKYMKKKEDGNFLVENNNLVLKDTSPKSIQAFNKEMNDLHGSMVELESIHSPIVFDESDVEVLSDITSNDILALEGIIEINVDDQTSEEKEDTQSA